MTWLAAYQKIIRAKGYKVRFVSLQDVFSDIDTKTGEIRIDLHRDNPVARNFLHELIHKCYEDMPEIDVRYWEGEIWSRLSQKQKLKLYKKLFQ